LETRRGYIYLTSGLIQLAIYLMLWLWDTYIASLICLLLGAIFLLILLVSLVVEWIEPSRVPRGYFLFMLIASIAPLLATLIFVLINGRPEWLS